MTNMKLKELSNLSEEDWSSVSSVDLLYIWESDGYIENLKLKEDSSVRKYIQILIEVDSLLDFLNRLLTDREITRDNIEIHIYR